MTKWKLVPVEPDEDMLDAASEVRYDLDRLRRNGIVRPLSVAASTGASIKAEYAAVLAAAPEAPRMTEHEITQIWSDAIVTGHRTLNSDVILFARAIERAHGIGEER